MSENKDAHPDDFHPLLPLILRLLAIVLFFYWGLTHFIYPQWYLVSIMGIDQYNPLDTYDVWSANLMGVLNVALAITVWRAATQPAKYRIIIDMVLMVSIGTLIVFVFSLVLRNLSPREWINAGLIAGAIVVLFALYPRKTASAT
jgi:hypothetical protein